MKPASVSGSDIAVQHRLLCTDIGPKGSGAIRYAAAMSLYNAGLIAADMLEIYRRCSKFDREDPVDLARFEGISPPSFAPTFSTDGSA